MVRIARTIFIFDNRNSRANGRFLMPKTVLHLQGTVLLITNIKINHDETQTTYTDLLYINKFYSKCPEFL